MTDVYVQHLITEQKGTVLHEQQATKFVTEDLLCCLPTTVMCLYIFWHHSGMIRHVELEPFVDCGLNIVNYLLLPYLQLITGLVKQSLLLHSFIFFLVNEM